MTDDKYFKAYYRIALAYKKMQDYERSFFNIKIAY